MKTKEFMRKVEGLGYSVRKGMSYLAVCNEMGYVLAMISTERQYEFSCYYNIGFENQLFHLIVDYAGTPPECREEEKKFYLRHRYFRFDNGSRKYLGMDLVKYKLDLYSKITYRWVKNQFTKKEIDEIKEKFNTDLKDFKKIDVKDED